MGNPFEVPNGGTYDALASRVARVEDDVTDIKTVLGELKVLMVRIDTRIETQLPHLATKAEIAQLEARTERRLGAMPTKTYLRDILRAQVTAYACGLAALAVLK